MKAPSRRLTRGSMLGKYRVLSKLGQGGFAAVYRARDTVEGREVALKVPFPQHLAHGGLDDLLKEVRITVQLDHPNILPIRNATIIDGQLIIACPLGTESLADRLRRRLSTRNCLIIYSQLLDAVAYAHERRVMHCDINPDNVILFPGPEAKLADFGIARIQLKTRLMSGSGSGTVGYMAPEQAMGRPSFRSDVFSLGLVGYRMLSGCLPRWPYEWPPPGIKRVRRKVSADFVGLLRRAMDPSERKRFRSAMTMRRAFARIERKVLRG